MTRKEMLKLCYGVIQVTRARSTGTLVLVVDGDKFGVDTDDGRQPFSTICDDHGGCIMHATKSLALSWAAAPHMWCPTCESLKEQQ
jgi:hypothetical protein